MEGTIELCVWLAGCKTCRLTPPLSSLGKKDKRHIRELRKASRIIIIIKKERGEGHRSCLKNLLRKVFFFFSVGTE